MCHDNDFDLYTLIVIEHFHFDAVHSGFDFVQAYAQPMQCLQKSGIAVQTGHGHDTQKIQGAWDMLRNDRTGFGLGTDPKFDQDPPSAIALLHSPPARGTQYNQPSTGIQRHGLVESMMWGYHPPNCMVRPICSVSSQWNREP